MQPSAAPPSSSCGNRHAGYPCLLRTIASVNTSIDGSPLTLTLTTGRPTIPSASAATPLPVAPAATSAVVVEGSEAPDAAPPALLWPSSCAIGSSRQPISVRQKKREVGVMLNDGCAGVPAAADAPCEAWRDAEVRVHVEMRRLALSVRAYAGAAKAEHSRPRALLARQRNHCSHFHWRLMQSVCSPL